MMHFFEKNGLRLARCLLMGAFAYSGVAKIVAPGQFSDVLSRYNLLPEWAINPVAILLPWWELGAALALLFPAWRKAAAAILSILSFAFLGATASALVRGLDIDCGCFGAAELKINVYTIFLDIGILIASIFVFSKTSLPSEG